MQRRNGQARQAFTLIELLVVVAIIALLISILLPSLRDAREQAKVAKCLAHYRQLTVVAVQYFLDYDDNFPFVAPKQIASDGSITGVCSWAYGGKTTHNVSWGSGDDMSSPSSPFYITIAERPFNPYLMGGKVPSDLLLPDNTLVRAEVPVLQCPSDHSTHQWIWSSWESGSATADENHSCYDDCGTSYQYNLHAMMDVNWNNSSESPWRKPGDWNDIGHELVKNVLVKQSASYVMFLEDPMDASFGGTTRAPEMGYHGKFSRYSVGFLDGHAEYKFIDTRAWCGPGWEALNKSWVVWPDKTPPIHYEVQGPVQNKSCEPPL